MYNFIGLQLKNETMYKVEIKINQIVFIALAFLLLTNISYSQRQIEIRTENNLNFGDAYMGYSTTINHTDAGAAKFRIRQTVLGNPYISVTLTLPTALVNGSYSVPVTFASTTSAYSNFDSPAGRINFNPNSPLITRLQRNNYLFIWLGGVSTVPTNIVPGFYTSTITITVTIL